MIGDERRDSLRKASGSWQISIDPEISEWGNPPLGVSHTEYIGMRGEPGELKHDRSGVSKNKDASLVFAGTLKIYSR